MHDLNISYISFNEKLVLLEFEEGFHWVNERDYDMSTQIFASATAVLIFVIILPITVNVSKSKTTFINILVILDCLNSAGHIPVLLQYVV